jgi:hypothetical protein
MFETNANTSVTNPSPFSNAKRGGSILDASPNAFAENYLLSIQDKREELIGGKTDNLKDVREDIDKFTSDLRSERVEMIHNFFNKIDIHKQNYNNQSKKVIRAGEPNSKQKKKLITGLADKLKTNEIDNMILVNNFGVFLNLLPLFCQPMGSSNLFDRKWRNMRKKT